MISLAVNLFIMVIFTMDYYKFYKNALPKEHDIVYVETVQDNGETFDVKILDYEGIIGCISLPNMTRRKRNKEYKKIGLKYPAVVLISDEKGLLLSKNKVPRDDIERHKEHYEFAKKFTEYGNIIFEFFKCHLEHNNIPVYDNAYTDVMDNSIWKYYASLNGELLTKEHLSQIANDFNILVDSPFFSPEFKTEFKSFINAHTERTLIEMCTLMEIKCYASDAISEIKNLFSTNYNDTYNFDICAKMQSPPIYSLTITGDNQNNMEQYLDQCIMDVKGKVNTDHTNFKILDEKKIMKNSTVSFVSFSTQEVKKWFIKSNKCNVTVPVVQNNC
jgi:translation initiation factor 2 alpha subunit (eIF-2alpha)